MGRRLLRYIIALTGGVLMCSCSVTRHLTPDSYMLTGNRIETDKSIPRNERITAGELNRYVRQNATKKLLGLNIPAWIYNMADPEKDNGWNNMLRKLGSEPVILDTSLTAASNANLKMYMDSRGYYESNSAYEITYRRNRKASVKYIVRQGKPYRINTFTYEYQDEFLEHVLQQDSSTLIHVGDIFDINILDEERQRVTTFLRDRGYYNFSVNNIYYRADTLANERLVNLTMILRQHLAGYTGDGEPIYEDNAVYRMGNIYVFPNYNATQAATNPDYLRSLDTIHYNGLNILSHGRPKIKPQALRRAIPLYPDYLYSALDQQRTSANLQRLDYFKNASVNYYEPRNDSGRYITYLDSDGTPFRTLERQLDCNIFCTPAMRQGYTLNFEATASSAFYALRPTISYLNRNLFRGAELLNISLSGGYEFNTDEATNKHSYEIGLSASVLFPRFFAPFPIDRSGKSSHPSTRIEAYTNLQRKSKYHRTVTGANLSYSWGNGRNMTYTVRPLEINIVDVSFIDNAFLQSIQNVYLRESYKSQYIAAISGSAVYFNPDTDRGNSITVRVNLETSGNLTDLLAHWISSPVTEAVSDDITPSTTPRTETFYKLFGIRYSQYFRIDASVANTIPLGYNMSIAYRFAAGIGIPYGNSSTLPMDRMLYVGGSNSMRGWPVRALGPGDASEGRNSGFKSQLGNMRLEANLEYRFPIWKALNGAIFFDVGNIWLAGIPGAAEDEVFRFDKFYKELGFNTGLGLRYDLGLIIIRFDWGIRLHDPSLPAGQRWLKAFKWGNTALNFGIGYPF